MSQTLLLTFRLVVTTFFSFNSSPLRVTPRVATRESSHKVPDQENGTDRGCHAQSDESSPSYGYNRCDHTVGWSAARGRQRRPRLGLRYQVFLRQRSSLPQEHRKSN